MAERVRGALALARHAHPIQLVPETVGISKVNRLFSVQYVHKGVLGGIMKEGFDPDRLDLAPTSDVQADAPGESRETGNGPDLAPTSDSQADAPGETDAPRDAPGDLAPTSVGP